MVGLLDRATATEYASWFKALADGTRVQLVSLLARAGRPMSVGEIVAAVAVGQSTVSAHLKVLAEVRFVLVEQRGTARYYRINEECVACFPTAADIVMGRSAPTRPDSASRLSSPPNRPDAGTARPEAETRDPLPSCLDNREDSPVSDAAPSVLFVCVRNGGKSQMAAGLMRRAAGDRVTVHSAGTNPGTSLNAQSVAALAELGADMSADQPKPIDPQLLSSVDLVVTLGREAQLEVPPGTELRNWDTDEPSERGIEGMERMRLIRDDIDRRVHTLLDELSTARHS